MHAGNPYLKLQLLLCILAGSLLPEPPASACECAGSAATIREDVVQAVARADVVFTGRVDKIFFWSPDSLSGISHALIAEFSTTHVFKGPKREKLFILTGGGGASGPGSADCGFPFREGETYLVYANGRDLSWMFSTSHCTRTALLSNAEADRRYLRNEAPEPEDLLSISDWLDYWTGRRSRKICGTLLWDKARYSGIKSLELFLWTWEDGEWVSRFLASKAAEDGSYCTPGLEPGRYKIGGTGGNWNQDWILGYYGSAQRPEDAQAIDVGPDADIYDIDINLDPLANNTIKGRVLVEGASAIPPGTLTVTACNDWDSRLRRGRKGIVRNDGTFEIPEMYPGRIRLTVSFTSEGPEDDGGWTATIPEILVPEDAGDVEIELVRGNFIDRMSRHFDTTR